MTSIDHALTRLSAQLPLQTRQAGLPDGYASVHRAVLRGFADQGRALSVSELAGETSAPITDVLERLAEDDLVVLVDGVLVGAYPFSAEQTPHRIAIEGRSCFAMCSLDAVAIAPVFGCEVRIESSCVVTDTDIRIRQSGDAVLAAQPADLRLGIRWVQPDGCAAHSMCREMVFLADAEVAESWRGSDPNAAGLFNLTEGIEFGYRFFRPLLG